VHNVLHPQGGLILPRGHPALIFRKSPWSSSVFAYNNLSIILEILYWIMASYRSPEVNSLRAIRPFMRIDHFPESLQYVLAKPMHDGAQIGWVWINLDGRLSKVSTAM